MSDSLDLNLLPVFDALMQTGSVTGAAERLHLSAPATSRALTRLRRAMGDDIMVRAGRGMAPTPFALRSTNRIRRILEDIDHLAGEGQGSDPASWRRTFRVRINDALVPVLTPAVLAPVRTEAPGVSIRFVAEGTESAEALRDGTVDIDVGVGGPDAPDIHRQAICQDTYVAAVAKHSALGAARGLSVDDLCAHPHINASRHGRTHSPVDDALSALGRHRHVAATVPSLTAAATLALEPDLIVPMPKLLAQHLRARGLPLTWHDLPLDLPPIDIAQHWHRRLDADQPTTWLRHQIHQAMA